MHTGYTPHYTTYTTAILQYPGKLVPGTPHSHQLPGFMDAEVRVSILLNSLHHLSITYNT